MSVLSLTRGRRAQSDVIGFALLTFLTVSGAATVLLLGGAAITDTQETVDADQMELAMTEFDASTSQVALGHAEAQHVDVGGATSRGTLGVEEVGWVRVRVINESDGSVETLIMNETLGALVYEGGRETIAYQGGGVWRGQGDNSTMVSPPEFHYREATLTMPVVTLSGDAGDARSLLVQKNGTTVSKYPDSSGGSDLVNPVEEGMVTLTIHSRYYQAWGRYFSDRTQGKVEVYHGNDTARVLLLGVTGNQEVTDAVAATASGGELLLNGNGAKTDSYNSSEGSYSAATASDNGTVVVGGDLTISGDAEIDGDIRAGGTVNLQNKNAEVGDVEHTTGFTANDDATYGSVSQISGVESVGAVDSLVQTKVDTVRKNNDNDETTVIQNNETNIAGGSAELDAGRYYFEHLTLSDRLVLNTTDGNVTIAVEDYVHLEKSAAANLTVTGDGSVKVYVEGDEEDGGGNNLYVGQNATVWVPGHDSKQFWVYGKSDFAGELTGSNSNPAVFVGVVYAPAGEDGSGDFYIQHGELYGGLVTGSTELGQDGAVHYDESLRAAKPVESGTDIVPVTYLHISLNRVNVSAP